MKNKIQTIEVENNETQSVEKIIEKTKLKKKTKKAKKS